MPAVRKGAKRKDKPDTRAASDSVGAQMSMMRKRTKKKCENPECTKGPKETPKVFEGLAITLYCSDECRFRAAYLRR